MSQRSGSKNRIGLAFPLRFSEGDKGRLMACTPEEHIRQSILAILLTGTRQRVMRPDYGSRAGDYLFENIDATTATLIKHEISLAIEQYEPRVEVTNIKVGSGAPDPGVISVELHYQILDTGMADQLSVDLRR